MDANTKTKSKTEAPEQFRELAEKGVAQSQKALDTLSAASDQTADVIKGLLNAVQGAQDYSNKVVEFAQTNTNATFDFAQRISGVRRRRSFFPVHARQQLETLGKPNQSAGGPCSAGIARDCGP